MCVCVCVCDQIRRVLLNEDEYGFRRPRGPIYYDEDESGLEVIKCDWLCTEFLLIEARISLL